VRAGVEPGGAAPEEFDPERAAFEIEAVEIRDSRVRRVWKV